jgi:hypothetical protein
VKPKAPDFDHTVPLPEDCILGWSGKAIYEYLRGQGLDIDRPHEMVASSKNPGMYVVNGYKITGDKERTS